MKRSVRCLTMISALAGAYLSHANAHAKELPNFDASYQALSTKAASVRASAIRSTTNPGIIASSVDPKSGVPHFFWGARETSPVSAISVKTTADVSARNLLSAVAPELGLSKAVIDSTIVREIHDTGSGAIVVRLEQEVDGIEVFRAAANVMLDRSHRLVAGSQNLHPAGISGSKRVSRSFSIATVDAIASAMLDMHGITLPLSNLVSKGEKAHFEAFDLLPTNDIALSSPALVKKVYFPLADVLVPAYLVSIATHSIDGVDSDAYNYVVAADDARILYRENRIHNAAFNYRVWVDAASDKRPLDGPQADFTPHPTGMPDGSVPPFIAPSLVSMDGFNKNPQGTFDPWLPAGATQSNGNNVDAYADANGDDSSAGDTRATVSSPGTFDKTYDPSLAPNANQNQVQAALAQIFYVNNWLHDYWYDSGFNEAAGNGQKSNLGRGGIEGDPLLAEGQDSASQAPNQGNRSNANMNPGLDGQSPRMQMYLWDGQTGVQSLKANNTTFPVGGAGYGPGSATVTAALILANDGNGTVTDACQAITNNVAGKIVIIDRGTCNFKQKTVNAQTAGAVGVIIADNQAAATPPFLGDGNPNVPVTIPSVSVTMADGNALKQALMGGAVNGTITTQAAVDRDGTIDNMIVAHEWGHYLHLRLVPCFQATCGGHSEGWADFVALQMMLREGDDPSKSYAMAIYSTAALGDSAYFGIRRFPYSTDMTINGLTFKHISNSATMPSGPQNPIPVENFEVHNAGEIWAAMLFEAQAALIERSKQPGAPYNFEGARRRMADYVVAGMKITPVDPTHTEQRDAILAAAAASDVEDLKLLAKAFAKRGAGSCAVSPPRDSADGEGVVESFEVKATMSDLNGGIDDSIQSCDGDGKLDANETGRVTIELRNTGVVELTDAVATIAAAKAGVTFPSGTQINFGTIQPFETVKATVEVAMDATVMNLDSLPLDITVKSAQTCDPQVKRAVVPYINVDELPASSTTESVESEIATWTKTGTGADTIWRRQVDADPNHVWHGDDSGTTSDTSLESPVITAGAGPVSITLKHKFDFEAGPGPGGGFQNYDGGVIEISTNNGQTWQDVTQFGPNPYTGNITNDPQSTNPLVGRGGFVGQNGGYPGYTNTTLDLGNSLANQSFKLRFRIGSDEYQGAGGWDIDDISVTGATNKPFASIVADQADCAGIPIADAGPDQTVGNGASVKLDGSKSTDPDGDPLTYAWVQTAGPQVMLTGETSATPTFAAPTVQADTTLTFQLTVSDGKGSSGDLVDIVVTLENATGTGGGLNIGEDGGCGCAVVGDDKKVPLGAFAGLGLFGAIAARLRRRRS